MDVLLTLRATVENLFSSFPFCYGLHRFVVPMTMFISMVDLDLEHNDQYVG